MKGGDGWRLSRGASVLVHGGGAFSLSSFSSLAGGLCAGLYKWVCPKWMIPQKALYCWSLRQFWKVQNERGLAG